MLANTSAIFRFMSPLDFGGMRRRHDFRVSLLDGAALSRYPGCSIILAA